MEEEVEKPHIPMTIDEAVEKLTSYGIGAMPRGKGKHAYINVFRFMKREKGEVGYKVDGPMGMIGPRYRSGKIDNSYPHSVEYNDIACGGASFGSPSLQQCVESVRSYFLDQDVEVTLRSGKKFLFWPGNLRFHTHTKSHISRWQIDGRNMSRNFPGHFAHWVIEGYRLTRHSAENKDVRLADIKEWRVVNPRAVRVNFPYPPRPPVVLPKKAARRRKR